MQAILAKLAPRQRQCVLLRYGEDLTEAQIASRLAISQRRVRYVFAAARKKLRPHGIRLPRPRFGRHRTEPASQLVPNGASEHGGMDFDAL